MSGGAIVTRMWRVVMINRFTLKRTEVPLLSHALFAKLIEFLRHEICYIAQPVGPLFEMGGRRIPSVPEF